MNQTPLARGTLALVVVVVLVTLALGVLAAPATATAFEGGTGTEEDPYQIANVTQLQAMEDDRYAHYVLVSDVDASETESWNGGDGFYPVVLEGTFDGQGYTISDLYINRSDSAITALFHSIQDGGVVANVVVENASVSGDDRVGILAGYNSGEVTNASVSGAVTSKSGRSGALIGMNYGEVSNSSASGTVSAEGDEVGGLIGLNSADGTVSNSSASGNVTGVEEVGGLIGYHRGDSVSTSSASVTVTGVERVGGLIGHNTADVSYSSASGTVSAESDEVSGLVGYASGGSITGSTATGAVSGGDWVGGLVGNGPSFISISGSFASGAISSDGPSGGLTAAPGMSISDSYWDVDSTGEDDSAGGTGLTTQQMTGMNATEYMAGFDFEGTWIPTAGYPMHHWDYYEALDGDGNEANPYQLSDIYEVQAITNAPDKEYALTADVDATATAGWHDGEGFDPIGDSSERFTGSFDGDGHTISNLTIDRPGESHVGLFGRTDDETTIKNVTVSNPSVTGGTSTGALVGESNGTIAATAVDGGEVTTGGTDRVDVGGLVGTVSNGSIDRSYSSATIDVAGQDVAGGLGGAIASDAVISRSYATGEVLNGNSEIGGLVGIATEGVTIEQAFATGSLSGTDDVGGLIGRGDGGNATVVDSYWDVDSTGTDVSAGGGTGLETAEMTGLEPTISMNEFGFYDVWMPGKDDSSYPEFARDTDFENGAAMVDALIAGDGDEANPYRLTMLSELQAMAENPTANYTLMDDIDAGATEDLFDGAGFEPVGNSSDPFTGTFDGQGYEISDLTVDRPSESYVGLFGYAEGDVTIENVSLVDVNVTGADHVGGLSGRLYGGSESLVTDVSVSGAVTGTGSEHIGGLAGQTNYGTYEGLTASVDVSAPDADTVGGLIGQTLNSGTVKDVSADGSVTGKSRVGGLIGHTSTYPTTIEDAHATGAVSGEDRVGGLIGLAAVTNGGSEEIIANVSATGLVQERGTPSERFGGLIGETSSDDDDVVVTNASASGDVDAPSADEVGGFVGVTGYEGEFRDVYATGNVTGGTDVGGFVGWTSGWTTTFTQVYSAGNVSGSSNVGGFAGSQDTEDDLTAVYWDAEVGPDDGYGDGTPDDELTGLETEQLTGMQATFYLDLDFFDTWIPTESTPVLAWQSAITDEDQIFTSTIPGTGTAADPIELSSIYEVQSIEYNRTAHYVLASDVEASVTEDWNDGAGFDPIGNESESFTGTFDGQAHTISNLTVNRSNESAVGLFARTENATVSNTTLKAATVTGADHVGGLVGIADDGTYETHEVTGEVTGTDRVGGLIGDASSPITLVNGTYDGGVTGADRVGGLVGIAAGGTYEALEVTGEVTGEERVGGSIGAVAPGSPTDSTLANVTVDATVDAVSSSGRFFGGLVGHIDANASDVAIRNVAVREAVTSADARAVGGLVGSVNGTASVSNTSVVVDVAGGEFVGGAVGTASDGSVTFDSVVVASEVIGVESVGGVVGHTDDADEYNIVYWDEEIGPAAAVGDGPSSDGIIGLDTHEMTGLNATFSMADLDFFEAWMPGEEPDAYPLLAREATATNRTEALDNFLDGSGDAADPFRLSTAHDVQMVAADVDSHFVLETHVDASDVVDWPAGDGFEPIGDEATPFEGSFAGGGYTISNLTVERPTEDAVGLFGVIGENGSVERLGLENVTVAGRDRVGPIAGENEGRVALTYAIGSVSGTDTVGGLIGENGATGELTESYVSAEVSGSTDVGGLIGVADGTVERTYWDENATDDLQHGDAIGSGLGEVTTLTAEDMAGPSALDAMDAFAFYEDWVVRPSSPALVSDAENGTESSPFRIETAGQLEGIAVNLTAHYTLVSDVDASETANWDGGDGFTPIGNQSAPFTGSLDGAGYAVENLSVDRYGEEHVGLIGYLGSSGVVERVTLADADVAATQDVGALVGVNEGTVIDSNASGSVAGILRIGGLIGTLEADGVVEESGASTVVEGDEHVGGLVGTSSGVVDASTATGAVTGEELVGGLAGRATGDVTATYAWGAVAGNVSAGGLVGTLDGGGTVLESYALGSVSGDDSIGGLVGTADPSSATITASYWNANGSADLNASDGVGTGDGAGVTGLEPDEMTDEDAITNMTAFSFYDRWVMTESYPEPVTSRANGTADAPFAVYRSEALRAIGENLDANYTLVTDIDVSGVDDFAPIGDESTPFTGTFDGAGHAIVDLSVDRDADDLGLFGVVGSSGTVRDVVLEDVGVTGENQRRLGGVAGVNDGTISDVVVVQGGIEGEAKLGLVVGENRDGTVIRSNASGVLAGTEAVGGLVGTNSNGTIAVSRAETVLRADADAGGLVGHSTGTITESYALGGASASARVGGLVGTNDGVLTDAYAAVDVAGLEDFGGLVGNTTTGSHARTYWDVNRSDSLADGDGIGTAPDDGVTALSTAEMMGLDGYAAMADLAFYGTWHVTDSYPELVAVDPLAENGSAAAPFTIDTPGQLTEVEHALDANYTLGANIDAGSLVDFEPLGNESVPFEGSFDGNGSVISNLTVARPAADEVGLFGVVGEHGTLDHVALENVTVTGNESVGGLVGTNHGTVRDAYVTGAVTGSDVVGGFVGDTESGSVAGAYAAVAVTGSSQVGGFAGAANETISGGYWDTSESPALAAAGVGEGTGPVTGLSREAITGPDAATHMDELSFFETWQTTDGHPTLLAVGVPGANGTAAAPYTVESVGELQSIANDLDAHYELASDVDASGFAGFDPIGDAEAPFAGSLDGVGYVVDGLTVPQPEETGVGLFGAVGENGTIERLGLENATIIGNESVGGLAGENAGSVTDTYVRGSVTGNDTVGGLVGLHEAGLVETSYVTASVVGDENGSVGGFVGERNASLAHTYWNVDESAALSAGDGVGAGNESGVTALETAAMTGSGAVDHMDGFAFADTWFTTATYPVLLNPDARGTPDAPLTISHVEELQAVAHDLTAHYELVEPVDASHAADFAPIGNASAPFEGSFSGNNSVVTNLTVSQSNGTDVGLFGVIGENGTVERLGLENATVNGHESVGALVGTNDGAVRDTYVTGTVSGDERVGGLVGENAGSVTASYAVVGVVGNESVGGFAGTVDGANGTVAGGYWNVESSPGLSGTDGVGAGDDTGVTALETATMTGPVAATHMPKLSFHDDWFVIDENEYPSLEPGAENGSIAAPFTIETIGQLRAVGNALDAHYVFETDVDGSVLDAASDADFDPIGDPETPFTGTLYGNGYAVTNLTVDRPEGSGVGLFGAIGESGSVERLGLENVAVTGNESVGGFVGVHEGSLSETYVTGSVSGTDRVGGLIGEHRGDVSGTYAAAAVSGTDRVGGLIGENVSGTVADAYWDADASANHTATDGVGAGVDAGVTARSTAEMTGADAVTALPAFAFYDTWRPTTSYPELVDPDENGSATAPFAVETAGQLEAIAENRWANYTLVTDVDAASVVDFEPIGDPDTPFEGTVRGADYAVTNLTVNRSAADAVGLFGAVGENASIHGLTIENATVIGNESVGALAGVSVGSVTASSATGTVSGGDSVGGLIGTAQGDGEVSESTASVGVTGDERVGGLVGTTTDESTITDVNASGAVSGTTSVGGLVGTASGDSILRSAATGSVTGTTSVGGLVGDFDATELAKSSATGTVTGDERVGGLVGTVAAGNLTATYATGTVTGDERVGGLVGTMAAGTVTETYAAGGVSGTTAVGGVIGETTGSIDVSAAYWNAEASQALDPTDGIGNDADDGVTALSTAEMTGATAITNMDALSFAETWFVTDTYPTLIDADERGTEAAPFVLDSPEALALMAVEPAAHFVLGADVDGGSIDDFAPIGNASTPFVGSFSGQGYTISNLTVERPAEDHVGFFGVLGENGSVERVGLENVTVHGNESVGGLVGMADGTVAESFVVGDVSGNVSVGGLVGTTRANATVTDSSAAGTVAGTESAGGLLGDAAGDVTRTYAAATVTADAAVGGSIGTRLEDANGTLAGNYWNVTTSPSLDATEGVGAVVENGTVSNATGTYSTAVTGLTAAEVDGFAAMEHASKLAFYDAWMPRTGGPALAWERPFDHSLLDGNGTETEPYEIGSVEELQLAAGNRSATYVLDTTIDATATTDWFDGAGFVPIGDEESPFTGSLVGDGHLITNVAIDRPNEDGVGLVGVLGTDGSIDRVGLVDATVSGGDDVGGLAGLTHGSVTRSYVTGSVHGEDGVGGSVGAVADGLIEDVYTTSAVSGTDTVGGLAGRATGGEVRHVVATGPVSGDDGVAASGGLVGALGHESGSDSGSGSGSDEDPTITAAYWDVEASPSLDATDGVGTGSTDGTTALETASLSGTTAVETLSLDFTDTWVGLDDAPVRLAWEVTAVTLTLEPPSVTTGEAASMAVAVDLIDGMSTTANETAAYTSSDDEIASIAGENSTVETPGVGNVTITANLAYHSDVAVLEVVEPEPIPLPAPVQGPAPLPPPDPAPEPAPDPLPVPEPDPGPTIAVTPHVTGTESVVSIDNATAGESFSIEAADHPLATSETVAVESLSITLTRDRSASVTVGTVDSPDDAGAVALEDGVADTTALGYFVVDHDLDDDVETATISTTVPGDVVDEAGGSAESLRVFHYTDDEWVELETHVTQIIDRPESNFSADTGAGSSNGDGAGTDGESITFRLDATTDGFSPFAVGVTEAPDDTDPDDDFVDDDEPDDDRGLLGILLTILGWLVFIVILVGVAGMLFVWFKHRDVTKYPEK